MEKRISYNDFQSIKRVAQACVPIIATRNKLGAKLQELVQKYNNAIAQIEALQAGIKKVYGFPVEALVKKVVESGVDTNGKPKKTTKYLPTDIVTYDEQHKQYVISVPDAVSTENKETPVEEEEKKATELTDDADNVVETTTEEPSTDTPKEKVEQKEEAPVKDETKVGIPNTTAESIWD